MSSMRWNRTLPALIAVIALAVSAPVAAAAPLAASPAATAQIPSVAAPFDRPVAETQAAELQQAVLQADEVTLTGTFRVAIADDFAGRTAQTIYSIDSTSGSTQLTVSGKDTRALDGALVSLTGHRGPGGSVSVAASSIVVQKTAAANPDANLGRNPQQGRLASPAAVQTRKVAVIVADYTDLAGYPVSNAEAVNNFTTDPASVKSFFEATSRGRVTTSTTVLGPWHLGISQCPGGNSSWSFGTSMNAALNAASAHGIDLTSYDHVVLWTKSPCHQGWAGIGYVPGRYVQMTVDRASYDLATASMVASHELGHNLGLAHSDGLACFSGTAQVEISSTCSSAVYYDEYSTMGMAGAPDHALLDADRLAGLGWLDSGEAANATSVGSYVLVPVYSATPGVRLLRVARPATVVPGGQSGSWTLEIRSALTGTAWDQFIGSPYSLEATGVTIRYSEDAYIGSGYTGESYMVDSVANGTTSGVNFWDSPFQQGTTFADAAGGFTFTITTVNGAGAIVTVGDTQAPTVPLSVAATGLPAGGAEVDWQAATDNLGLAHYRIYRDGSQIGEVSAATLTYTDPPAGFGGVHTYAVAAVDTAGLVGPQASDSATLVSPPTAPLSVTATAGNAAALVSWSAPAQGAPITGYTVTSSPGGFTCTTTGATSCIVSGLTNGQTYTFTVTATNNVGTGPASSDSNQVTPLTVPGRPTGVSGTAGDTTVAVTWTAPADSGSSSINHYAVTSSPEGRTCTTSGSIGCTVTGLTNGVTYTFTVAATNTLGAGLPSVPSAGVKPRTRPDAPVSVVALASNLSALVSWGAPPFDGGSAVTSWDVVSTPDGKTCHSVGPRSCTVLGLTNRVNYTFKVTATNVAGTSDPSLASPGAMPLFGATYMTVKPNRLVDSRSSQHVGLGASLSNNVPVSFQVTGRSADPLLNVPTGAVAVTGNLTAVNEGSKGYFSLTPSAPVGTPPTSTINFPAGDIRANAVTVPLGAGGKLWITFVGGAGKKADVVFDVTGYFVGNTSGATYKRLTPNRVLDSRLGRRIDMQASLTSGVPASFKVTDQSSDPNLNVPANAIAVVGNLTATGQGSKGYFSLTPDRPSGTPPTSTINFPAGDTRANAVVAPVGAGGLMWVTFVGTAGTHADVLLDVTGYFVQSTAGATYVALTPNRILDSRLGRRINMPASLTSGLPAGFTVVGQSVDAALNVPSDAVGVTGNLTAVGEGSKGWYGLTPDDPGGVPGTSTINFPQGDIRANAVLVPLGGAGDLWVTFVGTAGTIGDVIFDVSGYFTMN
jgi:hypothetical protein